ncbi:hypothetical protein AC1031_001838 [Aphanomyces cochlioides]|nr:hypothetical protein AC1031_001838 [Aphanomyces cochlioides]
MHDIELLKNVSHSKPWEAPYGKTMAELASIADNLKAARGFRLNTTAGAVKSRFELLMKKFKQSKLESMRKSGTSEEFDEREQLLNDISSRMTDFTETSLEKRDSAKRKAEGIETSGMIMRKMAMREFHDADPTTQHAKRSKKDKAPAVDIVSLVETIQKGIQEKNEQEARPNEILLERLEFDRTQAQTQAQAQAATQKVILDLVTALLQK